jgi:hypothetical protein
VSSKRLVSMSGVPPFAACRHSPDINEYTNRLAGRQRRQPDVRGPENRRKSVIGKRISDSLRMMLEVDLVRLRDSKKAPNILINTCINVEFGEHTNNCTNLSRRLTYD